jgi:hypothetical protein
MHPIVPIKNQHARPFLDNPESDHLLCQDMRSFGSGNMGCGHFLSPVAIVGKEGLDRRSLYM